MKHWSFHQYVAFAAYFVFEAAIVALPVDGKLYVVLASSIAWMCGCYFGSSEGKPPDPPAVVVSRDSRLS